MSLHWILLLLKAMTVFLGCNTNVLFNSYLVTGRLQCLYDLSCYFSKRGDCGRSTYGWMVNENKLLWKNELPKHEDITKSYFKRKVWGRNIVNVIQPHQSSPMFLVKCLLHMDMSNLFTISDNFGLPNDCMILVGEYTGMQKEWMNCKKNWYRDQAYEIIRHLHCTEKYFDDQSGPTSADFDSIMEFAEDCFPNDMKKVLFTAIEMGMKWMHDIREQQSHKILMVSSKWAEAIESYEADHALVYSVNKADTFTCKKKNQLDGWL